MKIALVEWIDSAAVGTGEWDRVSLQNFEPDVCRCKSVGFLFYQDDERVTIMPHVIDEDVDGQMQCRGGLTIPTSSIKKITIVRR